jgi:outer membrane protein TolC
MTDKRRTNNTQHAAGALLLLVSLCTTAAATTDTLYLTLAQAMKLALTGSPNRTLASITRTDGALAMARGIDGLLPEVSGSVSYDAVGGRSSGIDTAGTGDWSSNFTISQVVFSPSAFAGLATAAMRCSYNATSAWDQFARLAYDATVDYLNLLQTTRLQEVADAALKRASGNLDLVEEKRRLGMVSDVDLLRAQVQESQARLGLLQADRNRVSAAANFNATAGLGRGVVVVPVESLTAPPGLEVGDADSLVSVIERANPGLKMSRVSKAMADVGIGAAIGTFLPTVNLYWSTGKTGSSLGSALPDLSSTADASYGVRASVPLLDLKSYLLNVADAANSARRARTADRAAALQLNATAVDAVNGLVQARAAYDLAQSNLELSQRLHELATEQVRLGLISQVDFLQVDADLVQAQSSQVSATCDTYIQAARIAYLRGAAGEE